MSNSIRKIQRQIAKMDEQSKDKPAEPIAELSWPGASSGITVDPNGVMVFVEFNLERQAVKVDFDRKKIKTWDMVIGYLHMAILQAETQRELTIAGNMAKQQREKDEQEFIKMQLTHPTVRKILQH